MAENWIKVEKVTPGKPEVLGIASALGVHVDHAFGLCVRFWMWCDDQLASGHAQRVTKGALDTRLGCDGLSDALINVGWLRVREGSLEVPNFDRHLGKNAKKRATSSERKRKSRANKVTDESRKKCDIGHTKSVTPSLSISNSLFGEFDAEESFARFWKIYPSKGGKKEARKAWEKAIERVSKESKTDVETVAEKIFLAAQEYARFLRAVQNPPSVKYAQGWLNADRFEDDYTELASSHGPAPSGAGQTYDPDAKVGEGF